MSEATESLVEELAAEEYDYVETGELHEHPRNAEIYGEVDPNEGFIEDIDRNGVETPLIVNEHEDCQRVWDLPNTVIGGHRRLEAAKRAGMNRVPVRWVSYPEPMATVRVINNNNQRTKTDLQITNEAMVVEEIYRKQAVERKKVEGNQYTGQDGLTETFQEAQKGETNDFLADEIGADMSGRTLGKGIDVKRMAHPEKYVEGKDYIRNPEKYTDVSEEVREVAREQMGLLDEFDEDGKQKQSLNGAKVAVQEAIEEETREQTVESISKSVASETEEDVESIDVSHGDVWELRDHILYCGDTASKEFQSLVENAAFAFADPPYAAGVAEWDDDESEAFDWEHDWLHDVSDIVAVTPGIISIFDFAQRTTMPYQWSVASWIKNGMTRGDLGFGNWIYIALFADEDTSLHRDSQDVARVTVKTSETDETDHKGRKPSELMVWLLERFTDEGDTVVDPFAGSGSTLFAAEEMGRTCITGDLDPEFCADIITRWNESHPDQEASLWGDGQ